MGEEVDTEKPVDHKVQDNSNERTSKVREERYKEERKLNSR